MTLTLTLQWLMGQSNIKDRHNLLADLSCFVVLTPLAGISAWLCVTGAQHYNNDATNELNWETWGLTALTVFLIVIYLVWCSVSMTI
jgi:E3 ubiquitin-protein ligase MARCH2